ncbi:hypothetical protein TREES_T100010867 [Tupaia chinensis]|uniref:Uncharacterized protein n=1 Tax=Tupaia chinensis TaxID=246437 RepID=L9KM98_TUPCH|nr:hypothetical protein TREES_T100010867 [Tupaia chinensis]
MDSLYEPIPEQANQEGTSGRSGSPMSPLGDSGQAHDSLFMVIKSGDDPVESMGTLRRLQKLVWTKKARVQSLDEGKPTLTNPQDEDDTLISCLKLTKSQEKKFNNISPKSKEEIDIRLNSFSASLDRSSTSNSCNLEDILYHNDDEVQMWHSWKTFPENPLWTSIDFQIAQVGTWGNCSSCTHLPHLKSSYTDLDLLHSWNSPGHQEKEKSDCKALQLVKHEKRHQELGKEVALLQNRISKSETE